MVYFHLKGKKSKRDQKAAESLINIKIDIETMIQEVDKWAIEDMGKEQVDMEQLLKEERIGLMISEEIEMISMMNAEEITEESKTPMMQETNLMLEKEIETMVKEKEIETMVKEIEIEIEIETMVKEKEKGTMEDIGKEQVETLDMMIAKEIVKGSMIADEMI